MDWIKRWVKTHPEWRAAIVLTLIGNAAWVLIVKTVEHPYRDIGIIAVCLTMIGFVGAWLLGFGRSTAAGGPVDADDMARRWKQQKAEWEASPTGQLYRKIADPRLAFRDGAALRELTPLEHGLSVADTEPGTFFTVPALSVSQWMAKEPHFSSVAARLQGRDGEFITNDSLEVHHHLDGSFHFLAFTTQQTANRLRLDPPEWTQASLFPWMYDDSTELVKVAFNDLHRYNCRQFERGFLITADRIGSSSGSAEGPFVP